MSFAETYSAATASIVVSPATTGTSCIGPQLVGVIVPENVPFAVAPAEPAKTVIINVAAATAAMIRRGRKRTATSRHVARAPGAHGNRRGIYPRWGEMQPSIFRVGKR